MIRGSCLCGAVRFRAERPRTQVIACHCTQCRKQTGHYGAFTATAPGDLAVEDPDGRLSWYAASEAAERGFCRVCGSTLFWRPAHGRHVAIAAGALDGPTGLRLARHGYVADKGDYYDIPAGEDAE